MGVFATLERHVPTSARPWLRFEGESLGLTEILDRARRLAGGLEESGVAPGDRVAIMLPNSTEFIVAWFAVARLGAILVPLNVAAKGDGLAYVLDHSGGIVLITHPEFAREVAEVTPRLARPPRLVSAGPGSGEGWVASLTELEQVRDEPGVPEPSGNDVLSILYTSGTTGPPKGVMVTHHSYVRAGEEFVRRTVDARDDDVLFTTLPLFHINAQQLSTMGSILADLPLVLRPRFSASSFWSEIRTSGATVFNYIGAMLAILLKAPESPDDASNPARLTFGGGASKEIWTRFEERFGVEVVEGFGLTETATVCMTNPLADRRAGTIGKPVSWAEARVVDEQDEPVPSDTPGEIVVRSREPEVMMRGYYRMAEQTDVAMRGGWFHTGDRGRLDADGYFSFMDRLKDCIRRRGENISSFEVERAVNKHPAVLESAAVGVPSELGEEDVKIVVVLREGHELAPEELVRHCEGELARFMVPRYVEFRAELPKTPTERVQKFALRAEGAGSAWDREAAGRMQQEVGS